MKFSEVSLDALEFGAYSRRKIDVTGPTKFQIPKLYMPFGLSGFKGDFGPIKWNVDFALKGWSEPGSQTEKFFDFLKALEDRVVTHVYEHSEEIFGSCMSRDSVAAMFNSNIKASANGYEPKFRVKFDPATRVFDSNGTDVTTEELVDRMHSRQNGVAIIELCSVYFMNRMFGLTWKMTQLKVSPPKSQTAPPSEPAVLTGFQFSGV